MTKKECFNCKNNKESLKFYGGDEEDREHIELCCGDCAQNLLQKELDNNTTDWERNKKKFFKEALKKAKNKENFDGPFRVRRLNDKGNGRGDRFTTYCPQCKIMLDGDVIAYEDSRGHKCSQCRNCQKEIERGKQGQHFTGKDDNMPSYTCTKSVEKGEIVCHTCDNVKVHEKKCINVDCQTLEVKFFLV